MMDGPISSDTQTILRYYPVACRLEGCGVLVQFQRQEGDLLLMLLRAGRRGVAHTEIHNAFWPAKPYRQADAQRRQIIMRLRNKLRDNGLPIEIETVANSATVCDGKIVVDES